MVSIEAEDYFVWNGFTFYVTQSKSTGTAGMFTVTEPSTGMRLAGHHGTALAAWQAALEILDRNGIEKFKKAVEKGLVKVKAALANEEQDGDEKSGCSPTTPAESSAGRPKETPKKPDGY